MKIAYFDCFSGISGDMIMGACLGLGIDLAELRRELTKLNLPGFELRVEEVKRCGIAGTKVNVLVEEKVHPPRHLKDIEGIIYRSDLKQNVKEMSMQIFNRLAEAEAKIHATTLERVHFHEVGSLDAIVDIVGSAICQDMLALDEVYCSKVNVGSGFVNCQHGALPVPAPATLELLCGVPIYAYGSEKELVTPTGAAIIRNISRGFGPLPSMLVEKVGYGAGERDLEIPNLLRVMMGSRLVQEKGVQQGDHAHGKLG
jgi:uncharacterized protein (TIGR00299 family) protein